MKNQCCVTISILCGKNTIGILHARDLPGPSVGAQLGGTHEVQLSIQLAEDRFAAIWVTAFRPRLEGTRTVHAAIPASDVQHHVLRPQCQFSHVYRGREGERGGM